MNIRLRYSIVFPAAAWFEDQLLMGNYTLTMNLLTQTLDPQDQSIALDRVKYFLHNELHSTVFINQSNSDQAESFADLGLNVTTLPQEPVDQIVAIALYYKLNAIMEGRMKITELVFSSDIGDNVEYFHTDAEQTALFPDQGWWKQTGLSHSDILSNDDEENSGNNVITLNPTPESEWQEQELSWNQAEVTNDLAQVVFANFDQSQNETKH
jgi:hypothetical protein